MSTGVSLVWLALVTISEGQIFINGVPFHGDHNKCIDQINAYANGSLMFIFCKNVCESKNCNNHFFLCNWYIYIWSRVVMYRLYFFEKIWMENEFLTVEIFVRMNPSMTSVPVNVYWDPTPSWTYSLFLFILKGHNWQFWCYRILFHYLKLRQSKYWLMNMGPFHMNDKVILANT